MHELFKSDHQTSLGILQENQGLFLHTGWGWCINRKQSNLSIGLPFVVWSVYTKSSLLWFDNLANMIWKLAMY